MHSADYDSVKESSYPCRSSTRKRISGCYPRFRISKWKTCQSSVRIELPALRRARAVGSVKVTHEMLRSVGSITSAGSIPEGGGKCQCKSRPAVSDEHGTTLMMESDGRCPFRQENLLQWKERGRSIPRARHVRSEQPHETVLMVRLSLAYPGLQEQLETPYSRQGCYLLPSSICMR